MAKKMPKQVLDKLKSKPKPPKKHPMPTALKQHHDIKHGPGYKTKRKLKR